MSCDSPEELRTILGFSESLDPRSPSASMSVLTGKDVFSEVAGNSGSPRKIHQPVEDGYVEDLDGIEILLSHILRNKSPEEFSSMIFADPHFNPPKTKIEMTELLFEGFQIQEMNWTPSSFLSLISTGRITGLIFDIGHSSSTAVPLYESFVNEFGIRRSKLGGCHVDKMLRKLLSKHKNLKYVKSGDQETLNVVKQNFVKVADFTSLPPSLRSSFEGFQGWNEMKGKQTDRVCELPDGVKIMESDSVFTESSEILFHPSLLNLECGSIASLVFKTVKASPMDLTKPLLNNILVTGGTGNMKNLNVRLSEEIKNLVPPAIARDVKVTVMENPQFSAWQGGQVLSQLREGFEENWLQKEDYFELGAANLLDKKI
jgi:actin-related protein 2